MNRLQTLLQQALRPSRRNMMAALYRTKKHLKQSIGQPFRFEETSLFGPEYKGDGVYTVVGPGAYDRKWYATVTVKDGLISKVNPGRRRQSKKNPVVLEFWTPQNIRNKKGRIVVRPTSSQAFDYADAHGAIRIRDAFGTFRKLNGEWVQISSKGRGRQANPRRRVGLRAQFCPERVAPPSAFDPRSFRTVRVKGHRVTVGCPKGQYDASRRRCRVGTRAQRILHPVGEGKCPLPREIGRTKRPARKNPGETKIYDRVLAIVAERDDEHGMPQRYVHQVELEAPIFGVGPAGRRSLKIPAPSGRGQRLAQPAKVTIPRGGQKIVIE